MSHRLLLLAVLALAATACDVRGFGADDTSVPTVNNLAAIDGGDAGDAGSSASEAAAPAASTQGSPLCNAPPTGGCYPDDPTTAKACGLAPDGGPYNASGGYGDETLACRVSTPAAGATDATPAPACSQSGSAGDGAWCKSSSECTAAYDCVGAGTCQRYCCSGNVECIADEFCDIQPLAQASTVDIPVCMPIHPEGGCQLLDPSACSDTETCSVVRENGATSCVAVGSAKAHESCDESHCAAGLVCLGSMGQRECYQLCHTSSSDECTSSQTCKGGLPLFPDPTIGICQ